MKTVKKFTSFDDLKSYESKAIDKVLSLKKHKRFEKIIKEIRSFIPRKNNPAQSKEL